MRDDVSAADQKLHVELMHADNAKYANIIHSAI
jgi:hypothetical protein